MKSGRELIREIALEAIKYRGHIPAVRVVQLALFVARNTGGIK